MPAVRRLQSTTIIDQDITNEFEDFMKEAWPKALARLKVLCEGRGAA